MAQELNNQSDSFIIDLEKYNCSLCYQYFKKKIDQTYPNFLTYTYKTFLKEIRDVYNELIRMSIEIGYKEETNQYNYYQNYMEIIDKHKDSSCYERYDVKIKSS